MGRLSLAALFVVLATSAVGMVRAQTPPEALKGPDRQAYQDMKYLKNPVVVPGDEQATENNRALLAKQAKHLVGQLSDKRHIDADDFARVIEEAIITDLPVPRGLPVREMEKYLAFGNEMGEAMCRELEAPLKHSRIVVRLNAARFLSVVAELGCPKAAELALGVLAKPEESEAVKHWALRALRNLFAVEPDPANKDLSAFGYFKNRELENKSIVALCEYITTPHDVANKSAEEIAAITFIRREAVNALGFVRTPRLKYQGKVLARPALVLLKVANKDGIIPEPDLNERVHAVIGFCQLFPVVRSNADREVQCDFAANALGRAIHSFVEIKIGGQDDMRIPWKVTGHQLEFALNTWAKNVNDMRLNNTVAMATALQTQLKDMLEWLKNGKPGDDARATNFLQWLQENPPKSKVLFADEPDSTMKTIGN